MATVDVTQDQQDPTVVVDPPAVVEPAKKKASKPEPREYIVFGAVDSPAADVDGTWAILGRATTATKEDALEAIVSQLDAEDQDNRFVAVAARYWAESRPHVAPPPPPKRTWS